MVIPLMRPSLPAPPSWYPGHMARFAKALPTLLQRTDVVLEVRDARLPLTSINRTLEGALQRWRLERGQHQSSATMTKLGKPAPAAKGKSFGPSITGGTGSLCEHIVVLNKRDLVAQDKFEPFLGAMKEHFPHQTAFFASCQKSRDVRALSDMLVKMAKQHPDAPELNVLVVGMPNVGKSTLLNSLRHIGIAGPTAKALATSALPGMTRTLSTRLKLSEVPLIYSYDSPGVMLPFLGRGEKGAERGVKLALIAGVKEGMYDVETLAAYLLYRLNLSNPIAPAYLAILPKGTHPIDDVDLFLHTLAARLGMLKRGGERDVQRAAAWFVRWWREEGAVLCAKEPPLQSPTAAVDALVHPAVFGWGFDFQLSRDDPVPEDIRGTAKEIQWKFGRCIDDFMRAAEEEEAEGGGTSPTREKKMAREVLVKKRAAKSQAKYAAKRSKGRRD